MSKKPPILNRLRAAKAYADFTGRLPDSSYTVNLDDKPAAGYRLGQTVGVAYEATRDGITDQYFHKFRKHARPDLVVKDDGSQLYMVRGSYKVGSRGIEDMPSLMVLNPSPRPSLRRRTSKGRFMRLSAAPKRRRRARSHKSVSLFTRNPVGVPRVRRRRRRAVAHATRTRTVYRANPIRRRRRHSYRRNPIGGAGMLRITSLIMPAAGIAMGAIGSELAMGYLPIPANLKTGTMRHVTKGAISLAAGYGIARFGNRKVGEAFALGGLTIAFHDAMKDLMLKFWPSAQFGAYMRPGGMGYYNPGQQVPLGQMGGASLPKRVNSPGGPTAFGLYTSAFGGLPADGGPSLRMGV